MRVVLALLLAAGSFGMTALAQDIAGSQDHPIITRYPGSVIQWYSVENHRPFKLPIGPVTGYRAIDDWIETEGRVTRIYYALEGGARTHDEVYLNYKEALEKADFEILAEGLAPAGTRGGPVGSRQWREVYMLTNPFNSDGAVNNMAAGSATSGGSGCVIARKERPEGTAYVAVTVYQFRDDHVATLVDIVEVAQAETGLIVVDAAAIGRGIEEKGRVVLDGVLFDFDKATLMAESKAALDEIAKYLKANSSQTFYVVGHTDSKGTLEYNQKLSADRAKAVVDALVKDYGIAADRLSGHGVGPLVPVFTNESDAGRERNRRVELVER
ncbi:MAG: OmpA family protein [Candidatus Hydrogenedentes bacterium]|nr:OmpA family protein [Candidatus Hydrogenedentota bacterium]